MHGTPCLCTLPASAFIEPSLHQLDFFFFNPFMKTCAVSLLASTELAYTHMYIHVCVHMCMHVYSIVATWLDYQDSKFLLKTTIFELK